MFEDILIWELSKQAVTDAASLKGEDNDKRNAAVQQVRECITELGSRLRVDASIAMQSNTIEQAVEMAVSVRKMCGMSAKERERARAKREGREAPAETAAAEQESGAAPKRTAPARKK